MNKVKIGSVFLSEDTVRDQQGKPIVVGPLPDIFFKIVPNNFSFSINCSILYLKPDVAYDLEITMSHIAENINIIESRIDGFRIHPPESVQIANSFINLGVKNQEFPAFGEYELTVSIVEKSNPENKDSAKIIVPVLQRR